MRITAKPLINGVTVTVRITKPLINGVEWKNTEIGSLRHLLSRSAHDGRHISSVSAPTGTETTHAGHESIFQFKVGEDQRGPATARRRPLSRRRSEIRVYGEKRWSLIGGIRESRGRN